MQLTLYEIYNILNDYFSSIQLLESESASMARFNDRGIILFKSKYNNNEVALKCFFDKENENNLSRAEKEFNYLNNFKNNSGVVNVYDLLQLHNEGGQLVGYVLVEDYLDETLANFINSGKVFSQKQTITFLQQMDKTLRLLHYNNNKPIIHCDIKPSNIGMKYNNGYIEFVLFDFDIALESNGDREVSFSKLMGLTPEYSAPEIIEGISSQNNKENLVSNKADIYSIGVIALQLALNKKIYLNKDLIKQCGELNSALQPIISKLLIKDPFKRSSVILTKTNIIPTKGLLNRKLILIVILLSCIALALVLFSLTIIIR